MRNVDRLGLKMDTLWGSDLYGRPSRPHPLVALALADEGHEVRFGPDVPPGLRPKLANLIRRDASIEGLESIREHLSGPTMCEVERSYVFADVATPPPWRSDLRIVASEELDALSLERARPASWGDPEEWVELLAGRLGPWAVGVAEGRVASVCYTPVASMRAAEAGIWTHPAARGRGYAPAVVAAWAKVAASTFETLFYSADSGNVASQAVARKLRLGPIGTIAGIRAAGP